jgi:hypothetical protein
MAYKEKEDPRVTARLIRLRKAMGYDYHGGIKRFAEEWLGVTDDRWGGVERGSPLGKHLARIIVRRCPGVDLNWLWVGDTQGLSVGMAQRLGVLPAARGRTEGE